MRQRKVIMSFSLCLFLCCSSSLTFAELPHVFRNGDIADADKINESLNYLKEEIDELGRKVTCSASGTAVIGKWIGTAVTDGEFEFFSFVLRSDGSLLGSSETAEFGVVSITGTWTFSSSCRLDASGTSAIGDQMTAVAFLSDGGETMAALLYNSRTSRWYASDLIRFNN